MSKVIVSQLSKSFNHQKILNDISFSVNSGERIAY